MEAVREAWTDERLDDLANRVDRGFERSEARMDDGFRELRREINERLIAADNSANARFDAVDARFDAMNARFDSLNRNLIIALVTIVGAFIGSTFT